MKKALRHLKVKVPFAEKEHVLKNLLDSDGTFCYLWDTKQCHVVTCKLQEEGGGTSEIVHLVPTDTPLFQVTHLKVCPLGKWLRLSGPNGIIVLQLPSKIESSNGEIICRVLPIGER